MNFTYENQGTNTYLVYTISPEETIDTLSLGMLSNNKIPGLANTLFTQMDETKYIKYNVSAKVPVSQFFAGAVNKKRLLGVFKGIVSAIMSAEEYMIEENSILLDLDYIFADVSSCDTVLICLPVQRTTKQTDLGAFFKGIMFTTQFDQTENCDHVAKIINYLNSSPMLSLQDFNTLLLKIENGEGKPAPAAPQPQQPARPAAPVKQPVGAAPQPVRPAPQPVQQPVNVPQKPAAPVAPQPPIPGGVPVPAQPAANPNGDKGKGFSLFGMFSSKPDKKEAKAQPAKQPAPQAPKTGFEVPGAAGSKMGFEVPGVPGAKLGFEVPGQPAAPVQPAVPPRQAPAQKPVAEKPAAQQKQPAMPIPQPAAPVYQQPAQPAPQSHPVDFGGTVMLGGGLDGTVVLGATSAPKKAIPYLVRQKTNEKIQLNKEIFKIGKERSYVDYIVTGNTAVSRSHANILHHDGDYFVVDTNSTNHTFVNGVMIRSNEEVKLTHGTRIRFADEDFEFKMY